MKYDLSVERATLAPDGVEREMLVFNGQFPGPVIEADWGDWIQVRVTNNLGNNGYFFHDMFNKNFDPLAWYVSARNWRQ